MWNVILATLSSNDVRLNLSICKTFDFLEIIGRNNTSFGNCLSEWTLQKVANNILNIITVFRHKCWKTNWAFNTKQTNGKDSLGYVTKRMETFTGKIVLERHCINFGIIFLISVMFAQEPTYIASRAAKKKG